MSKVIALEERIPNRKAKLVWNLILKRRVTSKYELIEQTGMTASTVTRILEELLDGGVIVEAGRGESTGGRKPILYRTNPSYGYVFGLEISRFFSCLALFDADLNILVRKRWIMKADTTPDRLLEEIRASMVEMIEKQGIPREKILGMGIGAVGPLDRKSGIILDPLYFPAAGWKNVPIARYFTDRLNIPVLLENGANAALLGEYLADFGNEHRHLLYIHAGVGLRSAMMSGGKIVYGAVDMEGAVGQMIIQTDGVKPREPWGNYGCLESYATTYSLEQNARSGLRQGRATMLRELVEDPDQVTFIHLTEALAAKDPFVTELFTQAAVYFGIGLANLLNILHPEKVILGGPVVNSGPLFFEVAVETALKKTFYYPSYNVIFSLGKLGDDALVTGAAQLIFERMTDPELAPREA